MKACKTQRGQPLSAPSKPATPLSRPRLCWGGHGQWLPWLKEHVGFSDRTAQLYMRIAKLALESETVADLGVKAAAKILCTIVTPNYDPYAGLSDEAILGWPVPTVLGRLRLAP